MQDTKKAQIRFLFSVLRFKISQFLEEVNSLFLRKRFRLFNPCLDGV